MRTFKITNITNLLGKRSFKQNSELEADYIDGMLKKTLKIKSGETVYLTHQSLPLSIHRLRIKGLVTVSEISGKEMSTMVSAKKKKEGDSDTPKKTKKRTTKKTTKKTEEPLIDEFVEKKTTKRTTKKTEQPETEENGETKE
jgi:hypothetical protein